ncbi:MAG: pyridoxal phosphate-dependent aminotransferase [Polyangia bacterium]
MADTHRLFSHRLDWLPGENALATAEAHRRARGETVLDLTESNPTLADIHIHIHIDVDIGGDGGITGDPTAVPEAFRQPYWPDPRGLRSARRAVAENYRRGLPDLDDLDDLEDRLLLTTSSSESYSFLWKLLCDPGDTILVPEPSYPLFDYLARLEGVVTRPYRLEHDGTRTGDWHLGAHSLDQALANAPSRVAALVVVSPNNPTGTLLDQETLALLDVRAAARPFALVADEVFAPYAIRPGGMAVSFLAGRDTAALTFSLGGLSKSCGLPQMKLGWIAVGGPVDARRAALQRLELIGDTYLSVATPVQLALPELLRAGAARRDCIAARLAENRRFLEKLLDGSSPLSLLSSQGGWSAILRLPAIKTDEEWALSFLTEDGVLVHPGYFFDLRAFTTVVLSLLPRPDIFREATERLAASVVRHLR